LHAVRSAIAATAELLVSILLIKRLKYLCEIAHIRT